MRGLWTLDSGASKGPFAARPRNPAQFVVVLAKVKMQTPPSRGTVCRDFGQPQLVAMGWRQSAPAFVRTGGKCTARYGCERRARRILFRDTEVALLGMLSTVILRERKPPG